jgi:hypothetical protein
MAKSTKDMEVYKSDDDTVFLPTSVLDDLVFVARGDTDLVQQALIESLKLKRCGWFWLQKQWTIDMIEVVNRIVSRREIVDNLPLSDDETQINNG